MNTRKLSKSQSDRTPAMVVQSQWSFIPFSSSLIWPSEKYDVMRRPSEYWATSSGIAMFNIRESTQPALPFFVYRFSQALVHERTMRKFTAWLSTQA